MKSKTFKKNCSSKRQRTTSRTKIEKKSKKTLSAKGRLRIKIKSSQKIRHLMFRVQANMGHSLEVQRFSYSNPNTKRCPRTPLFLARCRNQFIRNQLHRRRSVEICPVATVQNATIDLFGRSITIASRSDMRAGLATDRRVIAL